jgi:hypothetical protein
MKIYKMKKAGISRPSIKRLNYCQYIRGQKSDEFLKFNICIESKYFKNMTDIRYFRESVFQNITTQNLF